MDRETVDVYEAQADDFLRRPQLDVPAEATAFAARVAPGALRLDLGSGPGRLTGALGAPAIALDAAHAMLRHVTSTGLRVQADLEAVPFRPGSIGGTYASKCLQHIPRERLPLALADLHRTMAVGAPLELRMFVGDGASTWTSDGDLPGRRFWDWPPDQLAEVVAGAGFEVTSVRVVPDPRPPDQVCISASRAHALPDVVGPGMRLLMCGLNPSVYSADAGVGYARPGNRYWPAMVAAGLVSRERDDRHALLHHGVGSTNLVARPSVAADVITADEYRVGLARVERLCAWLRPGAVCFVGLAGWRAAVDRKATPGVQDRTLAGVPVYVMPSTSGLNASTKPAGFVDHLHAAAELADG